MPLEKREYVPTPRGLKKDPDYRKCREGNFSGFSDVEKRRNLKKEELFFLLRRDKKTDSKIVVQLRGEHSNVKMDKEIYEMLLRAPNDEQYIRTMIGEVYFASGYIIPLDVFQSFHYKFNFDLTLVHKEVYEEYGAH